MLLYIQHKYMSNLILEPADVVFLFNFHYAFSGVAGPIFFIRKYYIKRQYRVNCCSGKVFKEQHQVYLIATNFFHNVFAFYL